MAGELQAYDATGNTVYAQVISEASGQIWNTSGSPAFENYATANIGDYDIAMTEQGTASGIYKGNMPSVSAGRYTVLYRRRAGGSPAETDTLVHMQNIDWDGSAHIGPSHLGARLPSALVSGRIDASVGAMAANTITASAVADGAIDAGALAADCITAAKIATDAVTEIQSGLSTLTSADVSAAVWNAATASYGSAGSYGALVETNLDATVSSRLASASYTAPDNTTITAIASYVDTEVAAIKAKTDNLPASPAASSDCITAAGVRSAVGLASANLDTQLSGISAKTNSLTFTVAGNLDVNIQYVNDVAVGGVGTSGNPWGPA